MRSTLLLAVILAISLALGTVCEESQEQTVPHGGRREKFPDINQLLKTLSGSGSVSVDELLKILGKASKDPKKLSLLQKRDMHDFFVGLMGKRNIQPASPSFWGQGEGHIQKNSNYTVYFTPDTPIGVNQENVPGFGSLEYPHNME